jgi:hypothetical protein
MRKQYIPKRRKKDPIEIFWCGNLSSKRGEKWSFPHQIERYLREYCAGRSVLHLFGGRARFGVRMDIDPLTRPDVLADAFLPPFGESSFDVVILDPPYPSHSEFDLGCDTVRPLLMNAAWLARQEVIWFASVWLDGYKWLRLERSMMVRVGHYAEIRVLQFLRPVVPKWKPATHFRRGPQIRYNRWLIPNGLLAFGPHPGPENPE